MNHTEMWGLIDTQRASAAEIFASLTDDQWSVTSLCDGWSVREVGAHLTLQSMGLGRTVRLALRHPGSINHVIDASARAEAAGLTTREIVDRLGLLVGVHRANPFTTVDDTLVDAVVHTFDATEPLGITVDLPERTALAVLDRLADYHRRGKTAVFHDVHVSGSRFVANDLCWSWGSGATVEATTTDLILTLSGRRRPS
ncbi:hypothetical protein ACH46_08885 [Gordonia phthalatica]|uniref:Mycothiol-dependent maleylpyruvate isomerase metal-binding domain-containing protein n=1 Tax=Gordonia phthalatica TaxID=1136941 RepID=A0A0N9NLS6_9ACTN|nr:hypothetical protein ACH46_08885 [Gordonia phthalatica]